MWSCSITNEFWENLQRTMIQECMNCENLIFHEELVLFGIQQNVVTDRILDLIILMAKLYIYKCKWKKVPPRINIFMTFLKERYKLEKYIHAITRKNENFLREWFPYQTLLA